MVFNKEPSVEDVEQYLDEREQFDEIYMMLFSHGVESVGLVSIERWREILARTRRKGEFVGVDPEKYPHDFAIYARYFTAIQQQMASRYPIPTPLELSVLDDFLRENGDRYRVRVSGSLRQVDQALVG